MTLCHLGSLGEPVTPGTVDQWVPTLVLIHPHVTLGPCAPLGVQSLQLSPWTATVNRLGMLSMRAQFENARSGLKDTRETSYPATALELRSVFLPWVFAGSGVSATLPTVVAGSSVDRNCTGKKGKCLMYCVCPR